MGDLANMTSVHGDVNGFRLLRWLRSKAEMYAKAEATAREMSQPVLTAWNGARRELLEDMAIDLERELTPPEYYGDEDEFRFLGLGDTGPCDGCGRVTDRVSVQDNGRAWFACQDCAERLGDNAVDLDDVAEMKTCPDCGRKHRGKFVGGDRCVVCVIRRERANDDNSVDLDDPAFLGRPEQE